MYKKYCYRYRIILYYIMLADLTLYMYLKYDLRMNIVVTLFLFILYYYIRLVYYYDFFLQFLHIVYFTL